MTLPTREQIDELCERSKDDRAIIVGSEVRLLCAAAERAIELQKLLETEQETICIAISRAEAAEAENKQLRLRLLSAAGDDLCRLSQEEIKELSSGAVKVPPKGEFLASCERFHEQLAAGPGVLSDCLTLAQLIAENEKLREQLDRATPKPIAGSLETYLTPGFYVIASDEAGPFDHQYVSVRDIDSGITTIGFIYYRIDDWMNFAAVAAERELAALKAQQEAQ